MKPDATVLAGSLTVNSTNDRWQEISHENIRQMLDVPLNHYLGAIAMRMTEHYGYDHKQITLGMVLAQAVAESAEWDFFNHSVTSFTLSAVTLGVID